MTVLRTENTPPSRTRDLSNQRFGRLLVIDFYGYKGNSYQYWNCVCDCGTKKEVSARSLVVGDSKSCGCLASELSVLRSTTHGMTKHHSGIYKIWVGMVQRCTNPKAESFKNYGGRGIKVFDEWVKSFESFLKYVGERPSKYHTIDRINNNGNYEPNNVRWATKAEQQQNKRNTIRLTINGVSATITEWSAISGTNRQTIITRYFRKYSHEECVYGRNVLKLN